MCYITKCAHGPSRPLTRLMLRRAHGRLEGGATRAEAAEGKGERHAPASAHTVCRSLLYPTVQASLSLSSSS